MEQNYFFKFWIFQTLYFPPFTIYLRQFSRGDTHNWSLLPTQAAMNVRIGSIGGGSLGFPEFPKWLGNYSRENKRRRLLGELATHLNASISGGTEVT